MHQLILQSGKQEFANPHTGQTTSLVQQLQPQLRMIANAAGGLLPTLAVELRQTFGANVLPSYGMTECMPISSPPATYALEKPGTSGVAVGPEIAILHPTTAKAFAVGEEGPVCVRGEPCFRGYGVLANDPSKKVVNAFMKGGWFNTVRCYVCVCVCYVGEMMCAVKEFIAVLTPPAFVLSSGRLGIPGRGWLPLYYRKIKGSVSIALPYT